MRIKLATKSFKLRISYLNLLLILYRDPELAGNHGYGLLLSFRYSLKLFIISPFLNDTIYSVCVILPPFIPAPKGDWVFWREAYKEKNTEEGKYYFSHVFSWSLVNPNSSTFQSRIGHSSRQIPRGNRRYPRKLFLGDSTRHYPQKLKYTLPHRNSMSIRNTLHFLRNRTVWASALHQDTVLGTNCCWNCLRTSCWTIQRTCLLPNILEADSHRTPSNLSG